VFRPRAGVNCWRVERAERFALLVDAAAYYRRLHQVLRRAQHSVFMVGWDFDSRAPLVPQAVEGAPAELGPLLDHIVRTRRGLDVHVLAWDFSTVFALERELGLIFNLGWKTHRRLHFRYDAKHPFGASQHQKIVTVDDVLAFSGGLDVTSRRWDTPAHRPHDVRREDHQGESYPPFHDVQCLVSGRAAAALSELARARWNRVERGAPPDPTPAAPGRAWPEDLSPDLEGVRVAIARTAAAFGGLPAVREVEISLLESIRGARRTIYLENQYFTSTSVTEALAERLREPAGPELVLVLPKTLSGWLEQRTMLPLAERALFRLRRADLHGRLRLLHPVASRARDVAVFVHAKVGCFDDELFRVGSANLSNRSMGLDSECDVLVLGESEAHCRAIAGLRERLMAEHLGTTPERVARTFAETKSLVRTIAALSDGDRTLAELAVPDTEPEEPVLTPDWEQPMEPTVFLETFLEELGRGRKRSWPRMAALVAVVLAAAASYAWLGVDAALAPTWVHRPLPLAALVVLGAFVLGSMLLVPRSLLVLATVLVLGPVTGALLATAALVSASLLAFLAGRAGGRELVRRVAGRGPLGIGRKLAGRGLTSIVLVRLVPVGPATVVDLACGSAQLPLGPFVLGSLLGSLPGVAAFALLGMRLAVLVREPSVPNLLLAAAPALVIVLAALWLDSYVADHDIRGQREVGAR
jgi:phospholipase D1/2